jgi:hypothetical protein
MRTSATSIVASTVLPFWFRLLPVTWLYCSAGNTGRTEAVIPPLGRARHDQDSSEPRREGLVTRKRLFSRPFRRLSADRTGSDTGSGLALSIVTAHGGMVDIRARAGGGLRVTVTLPLAAWPRRAGQFALAGASG